MAGRFRPCASASLREIRSGPTLHNPAGPTARSSSWQGRGSGEGAGFPLRRRGAEEGDGGRTVPSLRLGVSAGDPARTDVAQPGGPNGQKFILAGQGKRGAEQRFCSL